MIFCGDIALPFINSINLDIPEYLRNKRWIVNLEGSLVDSSEENLQKSVVFNDFNAIKQLTSSLKISGFSIANNHTFDIGDLNRSNFYFHQIGIPYFGSGLTIADAKKEFVCEDENSIEYEILSFGWSAIECKYATATESGVNPYTKENVLHVVKKVIAGNTLKRIICFFHWNYELELYPQPLDRELAKKIIDLGVYAVIGCHAHRVQGYEIYNGRPIIYGLGNFLFPQGIYMNKRLAFPAFSSKEIAVEITSMGQFLIHWFQYDSDRNIVSYIKTEELEKSKELELLSPFANLSNKQYKKWLKQNRFHKNKLLPLFYYSDSLLSSQLKIKYIKIRHQLILQLKGLK